MACSTEISLRIQLFWSLQGCERKAMKAKHVRWSAAKSPTRQTIVWNAAGTIALGKTVFFSGHDLMVFSSQETNFNSEIWSFSELVEAELPGNLGVYKT